MKFSFNMVCPVLAELSGGIQLGGRYLLLQQLLVENYSCQSSPSWSVLGKNFGLSEGVYNQKEKKNMHPSPK